MSAAPVNCELTAVSLEESDSETCDSSASYLGNGDSKTEILFAETRLSINAPLANGSIDPGSYSEAHSGFKAGPVHSGLASTDSSSVENDFCVDHDSELDWYCSSEGKLICSNCALVGSCQGHIVTPIARRAAKVRNQLVDMCEKMQLKALRIERFVNQNLATKECALQAEASRAREQVVARVSQVREALEEEEQRLLEVVQREEERVQQCLLTQRAHWTQALAALTHMRTGLVHTLTHTQDAQLVISSQEVADRVEEAEGVGDPRDTEQLSLAPGCSDSRLLLALWACSVLPGPSGAPTDCLRFDERTVSPLLSLSEDGRTLTFLPRRARQSPPYDPARFDRWPNALCSPALSSGTRSWVLDVSQSAAFKAGVCYAGMERKGEGSESRLGYNASSWVLSHYEDKFSFCHAGRHSQLALLRRPDRLGVLLDWPGHTLLFFDPDSCAVLHTVRHPFTAPLLPAFAVADHSVTLLR